jgi:hypothetical protein
LYLLATAGNTALVLLAITTHAYELARAQIDGLKPLAWGALFFLVAVMISLAKGGLWRHVVERIGRLATATDPDR